MVTYRARYNFSRKEGKRSASSQSDNWRSSSRSSSSSKEFDSYNKVLCYPLANPTLPPQLMKDLPRPNFSRSDLSKIMAARSCTRPYAYEPSYYERVIFLKHFGRDGLILLPSEEPELSAIIEKLVIKHTLLQRSVKTEDLEWRRPSSRTPTISPTFAPSKSLFKGKISNEYVR